MPDRRFREHVVIVTGASQGIGRATAEAFAREGAHVIVTYRSNRQGAQHTLTTILEKGGKGMVMEADISDLDACHRLIDRAEAVGPLTTLVNNAAAFSRQPFLEVTMADFDMVWAVNARGLFYLSQIAAQRMAHRQSGCIIHVSSILATKAVPGRAAYIASKGAVEALTRAMAIDLANSGVRVNAIAPGLIDTQALREGFPNDQLLAAVQQYIPGQRFGTASEVAEAILFLASDAASYINGIVLPVDNGLGVREAGPATTNASSLTHLKPA